jgi:ATP-dependent RNA helicase DeaD
MVEAGPARTEGAPEKGMERFRIEVGNKHEVKAGNIVGALANEAGLDSQYIGRINIHDDYSLVDLPEDMPKEVFKDLKKTWVSGQQLNISHFEKNKNPRVSAKRDSKVGGKKRNQNESKSGKKPKGKRNKLSVKKR